MSEHYQITAGDYTAHIAERGATLLRLTYQGDDVLASPDLPYQGAHLAPWPNRLANGRFTFQGQEYQMHINEPERNTALHGLVSDLAFTLTQRDDCSVTQEVVVTEHPPFGLALQIRHGLSEQGLTVDVTAANHGCSPFPYGYGAHPYFAADLRDTRLELPFLEEVLVDDRLLPTAVTPVTEEHDFTSSRLIGDTTFDTALTKPTQPTWTVRLTDRRRTVEISSNTSWVQVFTSPDRASIAVEPMTCGPNAFREGPTHHSRMVLNPGESTTCRWSVRILPA